MTSKTLLFLAASSQQVPFIKRAKALGYRVATCDNRPDNPGHRLADETANIDTTEKEAVLAFAKTLAVSGVIAAATDVALPAVAFASARLGLSAVSEKTVSILCDKAAFRTFQARTGLPHPDYFVAGETSPPSKAGGRWIVKPTRSSGSKGVAIISDGSIGIQQTASAAKHSIGGGALVERFLEGVQGTAEGIIVNGVVVNVLITDRQTAPPPFVATWGHRTPPQDLSTAVSASLIEQIETIAVQLQLEGPFDCDFVHEETAAVILELSPRAGGNHLAQLVHASTGYDWTGFVVSHAAGDMPASLTAWTPHAAGVCLLGSATGGRLSYDPNAASLLAQESWIQHIELTRAQGDVIAPFTDGAGSIGHVVYTAPSRSELDTRAAEIGSRLKVQIA